MGINNLPSSIQSVIQQGMLRTAFETPLRAKIGFRSIADREPFPAEIGETLTRTRTGLLPAITTPLPPAANTDFTSGLTPQNWPVEQYTLSVNQYAGNQMLNIKTSKVAIDSLFLRNAMTLAEQAARSVDLLAMTPLFNAYIGGNTFVTTTLGAAGTAIHVDNINGFQNTFNSEGQPVPVSGTYPVNVQVGSDIYSLVGVTADSTNSSVTPYGVSGTLTFSSSVTVADGTAGNAVVSSVAPYVIRPTVSSTGAQVATTAQISAANDLNSGRLTMEMLLAAKAWLADNGVPGVNDMSGLSSSGTYRLFCSPTQAKGLFSDPAFQYLYRGEPRSKEFRRGIVQDILGIDIIETNLNPVQTVSGVGNVQRGIMVGQGALIESDFTRTAYYGAVGDEDPEEEMAEIVDGIAHIVREPIDALKQVVTQSWSYIGGFVVPTDMTANTQTIPTASNSYYKRGAILESL